ncbi:MAG TPA: dihydropteroate synthase [Beijerinckiaceae bacterium]|nr:dihydropteroate synthase [Beijerinckiaceae bacterium]
MGERTLVMGVVNVTPDSFSDGGLNLTPSDAVASALRMAAEGADLVDLGGESTRPGHVTVPAEEEWNRLRPVFAGLAQAAAPLPPLAIDSWKADVARRAIVAGASIVNDVWGFQRDPAIAEVAAESGAAAILMHNREAADPQIDIVSDILRFLERSLAIAKAAGVPDDRILLDPGIGFGKTIAQSYEAVAALPRLKALGFPVLLGLSRKAFIGRLFEPQPAPAARLPGTIAANTYGVIAGADIIRVHDVAEHVQAMRVLDTLRRTAA